MVKKKKITTSLIKEIISGLFLLYMVGLLSQTVLPMWNAGINNGQFYFDVFINKPAPVNIIPFHTLYQYLYTNNTAVDGWKTAATLNLWANLLLFSPLGIFLPLLIKKCNSLLYVLGIGFITSFSIEFIQFFIGRRADIDDIILNLLGVLLGFITYLLCRFIISSCRKIAVSHK
jgi:Glycopeptide antibiotics resistance protein